MKNWLIPAITSVILSAATTVLPQITVAQTQERQVGSEQFGDCDYDCQQGAQQGAALCGQYEQALRGNPNDYALSAGYRRCQLALQKQGTCQYIGGSRVLAGESFDPRICNVHLYDFYQNEAQFLPQ